MRQYFDAKRQYRDAIVFFRMGDFYEMFYEDALTAARALELTLTSRSKDSTGGAIPMCGVPYHAADGYIARLVRKGFRVAVCEQVEDPEEGQGPRPARGGARRLAGHADRCGLSRCARAGVPDGASARCTRDPASASRCSISRPASSRPPSTPGPDGRQALADELSVLRPREIVLPAGFDDGGGARRRSCGSTRESRAADGWTFELESARRTLHDATADADAARVRPRRSPRRDVAPPARSCSTCATRRRRTWRTSARSRSAPAPTACSSIRRRCGISR